MYCNFAHRIFSGIRIDAYSRPENNAHPPTDNVTSVKNIIPGVFHQRELINAIAIAKVAVSSEINTSDVNCQVNAMSSVYWRSDIITDDTLQTWTFCNISLQNWKQ